MAQQGQQFDAVGGGGDQQMQPWQREQYQPQQQQQPPPAWQTDPRFNEQAQTNKTSKLLIVPAIIATFLIVLLSIIGLFMKSVRWDAELKRETDTFEGYLTVSKAVFKFTRVGNTSATVDINAGMSEWSDLNSNLGKLVSPIRFSTAVAVLLILFFFSIAVIQVLRIAGVINGPNAILRHYQGYSIIGLLILSIISAIVSSLSYRSNLDEINSWLQTQVDVVKVTARSGASGGGVILGLIVLICYVLLIVFAVRSWVGRRCQNCCCECCSCNLIDDVEPPAVVPPPAAAVPSGPPPQPQFQQQQQYPPVEQHSV